MSQVLTADQIRETKLNGSWVRHLPAILAVGGGFLMMFLKFEIGKAFISDASLMMIALACYILAALFQAMDVLRQVISRRQLDDAIPRHERSCVWPH